MPEHSWLRRWIPLFLLVIHSAGFAAACRVGALDEPSPAIAGTPAGSFTKPISFAILEDYDKGDDLGEIARDFAAFRELGVTTWRGSFGWDDYEPAPGRFDFEWLKRFAALADSTGILLRPYLAYTPGWAARGGADDHTWNDPPRRLEDWTRFVAALAGALVTQPVTVENYLGPAYREHFLAVADQRCGRKPIWINETGFATTPGKSERQQADWWVRAFATFLAAPRVEHLGIYEIKDQRKDTPVIGDEPNYHLGLLREDRTPKLAFHTVKLLLRLFDSDSITVADAELSARVTQGRARKLHHHLFVRPDGRQLIFLWDRESRHTLELRLSRPGKRVIAYELDGRGSAWAGFDGRVISGVKLVPGEVRVFEVEQ